MDIRSCIREGDLEKALGLAKDAVRAAPTDASARTALFELLCFSGDLERAQGQLDVIADESMEKAYGATALLGLLRAEQQRREVFKGTIPPDFKGEDSDWAKPWLAHLKGDSDANADALEKLRPPVKGKLNGEPFEDLRDGDDLLAPVLEVFAAGRYVWIRWDQVRALRSEPPRTLRDTAWMPVHLELGSEESFEAHVPVIYDGTVETDDGQLMLGLSTDWIEEAGLVRGRGRRMLFANGEEVDLLAVREIVVEP